MGVFGWRCGESDCRFSENSEDVNGRDSRACRDSEAMVMGRAKSDGEEVKAENAERREGDAGGR